MLRPMRRCWWIFALIAAVGCDTLGEFQTGEGEVYRGEIAGVNIPTGAPRRYEFDESLTVIEADYLGDAEAVAAAAAAVAAQAGTA